MAIDREGNARSHRGMGLVSEKFEESTLATLPGDVAVGHTRYSTTGSTVLANAQPCHVATRCGPLAIAHNGNIINAAEIKRELVEKGAIFTTSSDTEVLVHLIARSEADTVEDQIREALEQVDGAYSLVMSVGRTLYAVVDSRGFRPLVMGRLGGGMVLASETCALDLAGREHHVRAAAGRVRADRGWPRDRAAAAHAAPRQPLRVRAGVLRPARQHGVRRVGGPRPPGARAPARARAAGARRRGRVQRARQLERHGARLRRGLRHQARVRADPEPLRGPDLHQPDPEPPGGQGQDQVQPGARRDSGQVGRGGRRQPGARQHQQEPGADDPRGRGARKSICAWARRRSPARASTGSTRRRGRSSSPPPIRSRRSAQFLGVDSLGYLSLDGMLRAAGDEHRVLPRLLLRPATRRRFRASWSSSGTRLRSWRPRHERPRTRSPWSTSSGRGAPTAPPP